MSPAAVSSDRDTSDGFVVPYVLVLIGVLAVVSLFAMERLSRNTEVVRQLDARLRAETALASIQAEAVYTLMAASPLRDGFDLPGRIDPADAFLFGAAPEALPGANSPDTWVPDGQWRLVRDGAVAAQDAQGLLPLNTASEASVAALLIELGYPAREARLAAAKLADYVDADARRRSGGAEAPQYRMSDRPAPPDAPPNAPTNAPLRSFAELRNVMGWDAVLDVIDPAVLASFTTLDATQSGVSAKYAPDRLRRVLRMTESAPVAVTNDEFAFNNLPGAPPGLRTRLLMVVPDPDQPRLAVVELERRRGGFDAPFRTRPIASRALRPGELARYREAWETSDRLSYAAPGN